MKRILSCAASDFAETPARSELVEAIRASEGRVIMAQATAEDACVLGGVSNAELIASFGTDLVLIKVLDVEHPRIVNVGEGPEVVARAKRLTGRLVGVNLEVIGANGLSYDGPTILSERTIGAACSLRPDYLNLTAYRNKPGNDTEAVTDAVRLARAHFDGMIVLNKYASAAELCSENGWEGYLEAGADVLTLPAPGTVPGAHVAMLAPIAERIHAAGGLVSMSFATSQEGCDADTMRRLAIAAKEAGADLYDFGDANANGIADPENILTLSIAVRGKRHTYFRTAASINR